VIVIATDFSKAFDTVRHVSLLEKFAALDVPDYVYNWLVNFFSGRTQCTIFHNVTSELKEISASVVQGCAIGPASYVVNTSDLKVVHTGNVNNNFFSCCHRALPRVNPALLDTTSPIILTPLHSPFTPHFLSLLSPFPPSP